MAENKYSGVSLGTGNSQARASGELVTALYQTVEHGRNQISCVPGLLRQVIEEGAWRSYSLPHSSVVHSYPTFQAFVEEWLGITLDDLKATCEFASHIQKRLGRESEHDHEALRMLDLAMSKKVSQPSKVGKGE